MFKKQQSAQPDLYSLKRKLEQGLISRGSLEGAEFVTLNLLERSNSPLIKTAMMGHLEAIRVARAS